MKSLYEFTRPRIIVISALMMLVFLMFNSSASAEYGDVVLNNYSDAAGVQPVIFPHWFHRIRYRCKICHSDLGIKLKAGASEINMLKIINGEYCGACHNGQVAWAMENCDLCHSGKKGTPTHVQKSTPQGRVSPAEKPQ